MMLTPAAVSVHAGSRVNFIACTFRHLGQTALLIDEGSTGSLVANNTFWDASGSAIFLGDVDDANAPPGEQVCGAWVAYDTGRRTLDISNAGRRPRRL